MRTYELAIILDNTLSSDKRKKALSSIKEWMKGITVKKEDDLGEKAFTYPIKHQKSGYYYILSMEGETFPQDFEKKMMGSDQILRHLLIRTK